MKAPNSSFIGSISLCVVILMGGCATARHPSFADVAALPSQPDIPDPLVMLNGERVKSVKQWRNQRRPELKALFEHYMYGPLPPAPAEVHVSVVAEYSDFLDGQATLKLLQVQTGAADSGAPRIDLMLVTPHGRSAPAPTFLVMNFCGNHAVTEDKRVPLSKSWMWQNCPGCTNNEATEAARGSQAKDWPLAEIVRRGYAMACFYSGDVDPDRSDASTGIYAWLAGGDAAKNNPTNRCTIAAWAWGFMRCVDCLVKEPKVDAHRIAVLGHSRNAKTALLAGVMDERIAMIFAHQAGCGGTAPSRGKIGESVKAINTRFPHWFNAEFKRFDDEPDKLPFDQNCMLALCAPRPVLVSAAEGDQWGNPAGQFEMTRAAGAVYRFVGVEGLAATEMPPVGKLIDSRLGYYIREGKHSMTADDWRVFLDFADKRWAR